MSLTDRHRSSASDDIIFFLYRFDEEARWSDATYSWWRLWVGRMNQINRRVLQTTPKIAEECRRIQELQSDEEILELVKRLRDHPKVEWKDSIEKVIASGSSWPNSISKTISTK